MIGMALRHDDPAQRPGAMRREQRLVALAIAEETGVDQQVAVGCGDQIRVGNVLHHEDGVGDFFRRALLVARRDEGAKRGLLVVAHEPLSPNSIITLADCGVAAMPSPSITRSNGSLWLIIDAILSLSRGIAAITSGISVG